MGIAVNLVCKKRKTNFFFLNCINHISPYSEAKRGQLNLNKIIFKKKLRILEKQQNKNFLFKVNRIFLCVREETTLKNSIVSQYYKVYEL